MASVLRQRVVGSVVLLALATVFWPIIFVDPVSETDIVIEPMPPRPIIDESPLPLPQSARAAVEAKVAVPDRDVEAQASADSLTQLSEAREETVADSVASLPSRRSIDPSTLRTEAPTMSLRDSAGYAQAWVLQVATLSSKARADALVKELRSKDFTAFSRSFSRDGKLLWRIQIGPHLERARLETIKPQIDEALEVNSALIRYVQ